MNNTVFFCLFVFVTILLDQSILFIFKLRSLKGLSKIHVFMKESTFTAYVQILNVLQYKPKLFSLKGRGDAKQNLGQSSMA